jgi:hypothetical protein
MAGKNSRSSPGGSCSMPERILSAWTALEVLSPQSYRKPEDLVAGDRSRVLRLDGQRLPWESTPPQRKGFRLYFQVPLGSIRLQPAMNALLERWGDSRPERSENRKSCLLGLVTLDGRGQIVEAPAVSLSSFAWGVMRALEGDLSDLALWPHAERGLTARIEKIFRPERDQGDKENHGPCPVSRERLDAAHEELVRLLGIPNDWVEQTNFAIVSYVHFNDPNPPDSILLNSFFLEDLRLALELLKSGELPKVLRYYLAMDEPYPRRDVKDDMGALEEAIQPGLMPRAAWPVPGRFPPVLMQQAAVSLAFAETSQERILAVNGPPGTGKTTLLRDLVAAIVTERAKAMASFNDPEEAFRYSGQKLRAGEAWIHLYQLDASLRGHEMVVASTNNKAVENVSGEIPAVDAVDAAFTGLRYFKTISDAVHGRETWGLIAAVLGNLQNRSQFRQAFWWDADTSLQSYLSAILGKKPVVKETDPETGCEIERTPRVLEQENPPGSHAEALGQWKAAKDRFLQVYTKVERKLAKLERLRQEIGQIPSLRQSASDLEKRRKKLQITLRKVEVRVYEWKCKEEQAAKILRELKRCVEDHLASRPGWWASFFRTKRFRQWVRLREELAIQVTEAKNRREKAARRHRNAKTAYGDLQRSLKAPEVVLNALRTRLARIDDALERATGDGVIVPNDAFFAQSHEKRQACTVWLNEKINRLRYDVFVAAMALHRAFVDAAAKPLRHNLGALISAFGNSRRLSEDKLPLLPDLWSSLFLVVPLVSTTFASVHRMLGALPRESLGWLFIDEAGQAAPQAAVGATLRCQRVVVVGDPAQLEPVVELPDQLTQAICREFGIDHERWAAPVASVQTLADESCACQSEFHLQRGSRTIGVPLLVHRRCSEPMFGISNAIAYAGEMVSLKPPRPSRIMEVLGESCWFDVAGDTEDKWCPQEGKVLVELLKRLADNGVAPDFYVLSPFVIVAGRLREVIKESSVWTKWKEEDDLWPWLYERVGTVHTAQGREAEAVFLVLGAPAPNQSGARNWAGCRPNLLNVAVTRAKEALYVIGNRRLWKEAGVFAELDRRLPAGRKACE